MKYSIKILLALVVSGSSFSEVMAQVVLSDSIPKTKMVLPTLLRVGTDLLGATRSAIDETRDSWEIQAEVDIYRYFIAIEYGRESYRFANTNYDYENDGSYFRVGADINLIPREAFGSVLYFGLRYARSTFNEELSGVISDPVWDYVVINSTNNGIEARWIEIVTGMKAKIWKNMYLGYALRLKVSPKIKNPSELKLDPYQIPGFGLASQNSFYGVNYYVAWQFPFRQKFMAPRQP